MLKGAVLAGKEVYLCVDKPVLSILSTRLFNEAFQTCPGAFLPEGPATTPQSWEFQVCVFAWNSVVLQTLQVLWDTSAVATVSSSASHL